MSSPLPGRYGVTSPKHFFEHLNGKHLTYPPSSRSCGLNKLEGDDSSMTSFSIWQIPANHMLQDMNTAVTGPPQASISKQFFLTRRDPPVLIARKRHEHALCAITLLVQTSNILRPTTGPNDTKASTNGSVNEAYHRRCLWNYVQQALSSMSSVRTLLKETGISHII